MSGSVSSSILETEEDRKELLTLGRGALRKLLLETVVGSPSCKWSRSWGPVTQTVATRGPTSGCWEGCGKNKAGLSRQQCGDPGLTASLELSFSNQDVRLGLRCIDGASFPELGHKEVGAHTS